MPSKAGRNLTTTPAEGGVVMHYVGGMGEWSCIATWVGHGGVATWGYGGTHQYTSPLQWILPGWWQGVPAETAPGLQHCDPTLPPVPGPPLVPDWESLRH